MNELSPLLRSSRAPSPMIRHRCQPCEVAWSGPAASTCWVCDAPGIGLRAVVQRVDDELLELDFAPAG